MFSYEAVKLSLCKIKLRVSHIYPNDNYLSEFALKNHTFFIIICMYIIYIHTCIYIYIYERNMCSSYSCMGYHKDVQPLCNICVIS